MARRSSFWILLLMCVAGTSATGDRLVERVVITVDRSDRHQTILGWGADQSPTGEQMSTMLDPYPVKLFDQLYDDAVDVFGFNSLRILSHHHPPDRLWEPVNDNADPLVADPAGFNFAWLDLVAQRDLLPLKRRVEANGERFHIYLSMGNFGPNGTPAWLQNSPAEWAEYLFTAVKYLKEQHAIDVASVAVINEPQFAASTYANAAFIAPIVKALGERMTQAGYATRIQFPEAFDPRMAWQLQIAPLRNDNDFWRHVGMITYHKYGVDDPYRASILELAQARGIPVGQTEQDGLLATVQGLYDDLVIGGVSRWGASFTMVGLREQAGLALMSEGTCATCHGESTMAGVIDPMRVSKPRDWVASHLLDPQMIAPGLRTAPVTNQHDNEAILAALARGRAGAAPVVSLEESAVAVLFNRNCLRCHVMGPVGGKDGPALTDVGARIDEARLVRQITDPLSVKPDGEMQEFASKLTPAEIGALAKWLSRKLGT